MKLKLLLHLHHQEIHEIVSFAGLSYISFRILSVYIDAEPGDKAVSFLEYASFLIFTPSILIGPIDRFPRFSEDLKGGYSRLNAKSFFDGWQSLIVGILYKFICAEAIDRYWLSAIDSKSIRFADMASTMYSYYIYLFFDFAGYSAMAIGLGKMMGVALPVNFNKPFLAINPPDLWRRWQKTLGDWLKDYFFTPIYSASSRNKLLKPYPLFRQNIALFTTFLLMGCWNGLEWNYVVSGMLFGIYSAVYNTYVYYCKKQRRDIVFGNMNPKIVKCISIFIMFNLVAFAIYIFSGRFHLPH